MTEDVSLEGILGPQPLLFLSSVSWPQGEQLRSATCLHHDVLLATGPKATILPHHGQKPPKL